MITRIKPRFSSQVNPTWFWDDPTHLIWIKRTKLKFSRLKEMNDHGGIQDKCPPEPKI